MRKWLLDNLNIPQKTVINRHIPKKQFYENSQLSASDKKLITSEIDSVYLLSVCNQNTLNVPKHIAEERRYEEIYWLTVSYKSTKQMERMSKIIHNALPNPVVMINIDGHDLVHFSTAHKRLNQVDDSKAVLDTIIMSPWISLNNLNEEQERMLTRLSFDRLNYRNLYDFYDSVHGAIQMSSLIDIINAYPRPEQAKERVLPILQSLNELDENLHALQKEQQEHLGFGEKMELHMKIKEQEKKKEQLMNQLKELC